MNLDMVIQTRLRLLKGESVPPEELRACIDWLRQERQSSRGSGGKKTKTKQATASSQALEDLRRLLDE